MFYSQMFLARKSPLGTVWIAAHLQHKLRKNHVSVTNIPSTVDYIMLSDVPIALRLSAHLLLGVVRIYSKKVDYLFHDCNDILTRIRTLFASMQEINLPEDATCAPFYSITLPETFELDALDLDDASYHEGLLDNHVTAPEEITITDPTPGEVDPYVTFFLNEDIRMDVLPPEEIPDTGVRPMDEDAPISQVDSGVGDSAHVPVNQPEEFNQNLPEEALPEIEVMRDAVNDFGSGNFEEWLGLGNDVTEQHGSSHQTMNEKVNLSPIVEDLPYCGGQPLSPQFHADPLSIGALPETLENLNTSASPGYGLGNASFELAIQPTPPVEKQKAKSRKRKQFFDTTVVLSNKFIKEGLDDTSDLRRKRKNLPCSALDVWMCNKRSRMDQVFLDTSISGLCVELQEISKKEFMKVPMVPAQDTHVEDSGTVPVEDTRLETGASVPAVEAHLESSGPVPVVDSHLEAWEANSPVPMPEFDMTIERLRFDEDPYSSALPEFTSSPFRGDEFTPFPTSNIDSDPPTGSLLDTEPLPTLERTASTTLSSEIETPMTRFEQQFDMDGTGLSDIPELRNSVEEEDLCFLDADNTPVGHTENEVHALSARTRAVAQYLKDQSPTTEVSKDQSGKLSLNKILDGKTRKKCGRMFFETLVLKSYGLIGVQQEEPYGDITLLLDPLSNAKF